MLCFACKLDALTKLCVSVLLSRASLSGSCLSESQVESLLSENQLEAI